MLKDFKDDWEGKIYFCAPSGTRDVVIYWKDSNWNPTTRIYLPDESRGSNISTINMINKLRKNNPNIKTFALSTNTTALKQGISLMIILGIKMLKSLCIFKKSYLKRNH